MALVVPGRTERGVYGDFRVGGDVYIDDDLAVTGDSAITGTTTGAITNRPVYTAARTLTAADNNAFCIFNSAAGDIYTLPAAAAGLSFEFVVVVTITSNAAKVICTSGDFLLGSYMQSTDGTYVTAAHAANGTTHVAWSGNGSTTGGLAGDWLRVTAISASQWVVSGLGRATGTEATPFATS
jgi:hypothetical protein